MSVEKIKQGLVRHRHRIIEVFKYALGCGCGVLLKVAVTALATAMALPIWAGYLAAQVVVLVFAYGFHSRVTFARTEKLTWRARLHDFGLFFMSVLGFKLADYFLVVLGSSALLKVLSHYEILTMELRQLLSSGCIIVVSVLLFAFRYIMYRYLFRKPESGAAC